jgi:hypothetical protein
MPGENPSKFRRVSGIPPETEAETETGQVDLTKSEDEPPSGEPSAPAAQAVAPVPPVPSWADDVPLREVLRRIGSPVVVVVGAAILAM